MSINFPTNQGKNLCVCFFPQKKAHFSFSSPFCICTPPPMCSWKGGCVGKGQWVCSPAVVIIILSPVEHFFNVFFRFKSAWHMVDLCCKG